MKKPRHPDRVRHDRDRAVLLDILAKRGVGQEIEFRELLEQADLYDRPMSLKTLEFHIRYMAGKGWVGFQESCPADSKVPEIRTVWITAQGVDVIDFGNHE